MAPPSGSGSYVHVSVKFSLSEETGFNCLYVLLVFFQTHSSTQIQTFLLELREATVSVFMDLGDSCVSTKETQGRMSEMLMLIQLIDFPACTVSECDLVCVMPPAQSTQVPPPLTETKQHFASCENTSDWDNLPLCATCKN